MCSLTETFDYYCTEICDLLLSLFILCSLDYYVALIIMCSVVAIMSWLSVTCVRRKMGLEFPHFLLFPKGGGVRLRVYRALFVGPCTDVCVY